MTRALFPPGAALPLAAAGRLAGPDTCRPARPDSYPPYDVEALGAGALRVTIAVAGFAENELSVTAEAGRLVVRGRRCAEAAEADEARAYLHRGIAARRFERAFALPAGTEVRGATLARGLLAIDLERAAPGTVGRRIPIAQATAPEEGGRAR